MKISYLFLFIAAIFIFIDPSFGQEKITIYLDGKHILSSQTYTFELIDLKCNTNIGMIDVSGNQRVAIQICSESGNGSIRRRNVTLNGHWVDSAFIKNGDSVNP